MNFPPELVDRFIDYLHDDDHALGNCALVSKTWLPASRYHLFSLVVLFNANWMAFLRLLTSPFATFTPHFVHTLAFAKTVGSSTILASLLDDILPKLPQFPAFTSLYLGILNWRFLSPHTVTSLAAQFVNITALDIRHVYFQDIQELVGVISLFHHLKKISVAPSFRGNAANPQIAPFPDLPRGLVHVAVRWFGRPGTRDMLMEALPWLEDTSILHSSPIQRLELAMVAPFALPALGRLLRVLGSQLQALDIKLLYGTTADDIDNDIDLSENTNMRDLTVHVTSSEHTWGFVSAVRAPIRTLTIHFSLDSHTTLDNFNWHTLTSLLGQSSHFAALQTLQFVVFSLRNEGVQALKAAVRARVAELDARGIVDVEVLGRP
ncbi:hypothetical protein C8R46DRAFT_429892 [Mycena filopes]|nr:hypothetical protein C8R46DRAFT_429892 [Mycena filopes]